MEAKILDSIMLGLVAIETVISIKMALMVKDAIGSKDWPCVMATVKSTNIQEIKDNDYNHNYYWPKIEYEYTINGKKYSSLQNKFEHPTGVGKNELEVKAYLESTTKNNQIKIKYNPKKPSISTTNNSIQVWRIGLLWSFSALLFTVIVFSIYKG